MDLHTRLYFFTVTPQNIPLIKTITNVSACHVYREGDQIAREIMGLSGSIEQNGVVKLYHHGIYEGGKFVIDYNDNSKIRRVTLIEFREDQTLFRISYKPEPTPLEPEEIVKKAQVAYATPGDFGTYNIRINNCEHFATYCKYGKRWSPQVVKAAALTGSAALTAVGIVGSVIATVKNC